MKIGIAVFWVTIAAVSFGLLTPLIKIGYSNGWMASQMTSSQLLMGAVFFWFFSIWRKQVRVSGDGDRRALLIGFFGLGFSTVCYNQSMLYIPASIAVVWMFQFVWMTVALESVLRRKWPAWRSWLAVMFVVSGTMLASSFIRLHPSEGLHVEVEGLIWEGTVWGMLSGLGYAIFISGSSRLPDHTDPYRNTGMMLLATIPWALLLLILDPDGLRSLEQFDGQQWMIWLLWGGLLGFLGHVLPVIGYQKGSPVLGGTKSALIGSLELPVAVAGSLILLSEPLTGLQALGIGLILLGIIWSQTAK